LTSSEKLVAYTLSDYWNGDGTCPPWGGVPAEGAGPSRRTLAAETGLSVRTIDRSLSSLVRKGLICVTHRGVGRTSNRYKIAGVNVQKQRRRKRKEASRHDDDLRDL
jgi:DNA-binding transcriptional regulator YhcF (GntR family)